MTQPDEPEIAVFAQCWNEGKFFEAHEVLEGVWVRRRDKGLQGLIQVAVALYHIQRGNVRGARTMIDRATPRLLDKNNAPCSIDQHAVADYAVRLKGALDSENLADVVASRPRL
jgi:hypothetical protein